MAAGVQETRAFKNAIKPFEDRNFLQAEKWLSEFLQKYPNSEFKAEAILFQGKSEFYQSNFVAAVDLLQAHLPEAGLLADQYHYWIAESRFQSGQYDAAAQAYRQIIQTYPDSSLALEAAYNEALSAFRLLQYSRVAELLGSTNSVFTKLAAESPANPTTIEGQLLLADAMFRLKQNVACAERLRKLEGKPLSASQKLRQQYLLCRVQLAQGQLEAALTASSNVLQSSTANLPAEWIIELSRVQGEVLEKLKRLPEAVAAYERNLTIENAPAGTRRQALFRIIELTLAQKKPEEAIARLEKFIEQRTNDTSLDLAFFTLGELRLQQFLNPTNSRADTLTSSNLLQGAVTSFDRVIVEYPQSELLGKTFLYRGWCGWVASNYQSAATDFSEAVSRLPRSDDQAIARFKLADCQYQQRDLSKAIENYNQLIRDHADSASITNSLFDQALYQIVRAGLAINDVDSASAALSKILQWYPNSGFTERSVLLFGQDLNRKRSPREARELLENFASKAAGSKLTPQVQLAIARTYTQEKNWKEALAAYEEWSLTFTNNPLLPEAEFSRALTVAHAGQETNAFGLFTNFLARFPTNNFAPLAQNWIADFYFNRDEFALAEQNYQLVDKYGPSLELSCQSRLAAGLAAVKRAGDKSGYEQAAKYFLNLINDKNTPEHFVSESYFALGDTYFDIFIAETNKFSPDATNYFEGAVSAFSQLIKDTSTNAISALALGRRGDCLLQWARIKADDAKLKLAFTDYTNLIAMTTVDVSTRAQAQVGAAKITEIQGAIDDAWGRYMQVVYDAEAGEFDPVWVREAAVAAARISENRSKWDQAISIYRRTMAVLPALKPTLEKKIASARLHSESVQP